MVLKYVALPLESIADNQIHYGVNIQTVNTGKKRWKRNFNKGIYKQMRTYLASITWTDLTKDKTAT